MKKLGYHSISAFITDAILDEKLTVEICQDPVKYDYSHSIRQLITAIPTLDKRWILTEKEFTDACNISGVDLALIHRLLEKYDSLQKRYDNNRITYKSMEQRKYKRKDRSVSPTTAQKISLSLKCNPSTW